MQPADTVPQSFRWHRRTNNLLTIVALGLGLYIALAPFLPQIGWTLHHKSRIQAVQAVVQKQATPGVPIPDTNQLLIPSLGMQEAIYTGPTATELSKGAWLIPHASTPDKGSNTAIAGHRFDWYGAAVFYNLDKVQLNDPIVIDWNQKEYTYKVEAITVVPPTEVSVEAPTDKPTLTLYTCTPLWTAKSRLVIRAALQGVRS